MNTRNKNILRRLLLLISALLTIVLMLAILNILPIQFLKEEIAHFIYLIVSFIVIVIFYLISKPVIIHKVTNIEQHLKSNTQVEKKDHTIEESQLMASKIEKSIKGLSSIEDFTVFCDTFLSQLSKVIPAVQGIMFVLDPEKKKFHTQGTFAFYSTESYREFELGEGITGQVAKNQKCLFVSQVPSGYVQILSGLGQGSPEFLVLIPIIHEQQTIAIVELASFEKNDRSNELFFIQLASELSKLLLRFIKL